LTSPCRRQTTNEPCDVRLLGSQAGLVSGSTKPPWDASSRGEAGCTTLGDLLYRAINIGGKVATEVEYSTVLGDLLKIGTNNLDETTPEQEAYIKAKLPIINLYVYCSPCVCLIHTAMSIRTRLQSPFVKVQLRPDNRLVSSCCSTVDRSLGMRSLDAWIRDWEARAMHYGSEILAGYLDTVWLDQRLEHLDNEQPYKFQESSGPRYHYLVLGEADYISHMLQKAPGRIPRATEIWSLCPATKHVAATRTFFSRFIEHRPAAPPEELRVHSSSSSAPVMPPYPANLVSPPQGLRRPASPSSSASASRRRRYNLGPPGVDGTSQGEGSARSEAEDMEI